ncbi:MAG: class I SAM-dependent methyltransferase [Deltaproteobacteria bacterium]|nr:MAG: class I SAM-dependent methyltransferase [Deltaproteobacteria bacterium]
MSAERTRSFFDEMAKTYDDDLRALGWNPVSVVREWPFAVAPGERVLDAGCGTGALLQHLAGAARRLSGFDLSEGMVARARARRSLRDADLRVHDAGQPWPFPDGSFDVVFAFGMLEFVEQLDRAFDELGRVLAPHGRALVSVEDIVDWEGEQRPGMELRYGRFPLWRRTLEDVDVRLPPGLDIVTARRQPAYVVLELGFTTAYHVIELVRRPIGSG